MENRKSLDLCKIASSLAILVMTFVPGVAFAYELETHAGLTQEIVKFYNQSFADRALTDADVALLVDGSRREDDDPRWMNHYYDPIHNTGLTAIPGNWLSSKAWAHDARAQTAMLYNPAKRSPLALYYAVFDADQLTTTDFTWPRAIADYVAGDHERGLHGLGHVLHLIEDAGVPDHTRNDAHGLGSPYERWAEQFTLENIDVLQYLYTQKPIALDTLDAYFDGIANYSNKNFYSKDTIDDPAYAEPKPDYIGQEGKYFYGYKIDDFGDYRIVTYILRDDGTKVSTLKDASNLVLRDYWERLAPKAVQYGAGVVDLFFREVAKRNEQEKLKTTDHLSSDVATPTSLLASIMNTAQSFFGSSQEVDIIPLDELKEQSSQNNNVGLLRSARNDNTKIASPRGAGLAMTEKNERVVVAQLAPRPAAEIVVQPSQNNNNDDGQGNPSINSGTINSLERVVVPVAATVPAAFTTCSYASGDGESRRVSSGAVIISEVAWMGSEKSASDEWIELQNISGSAIDLGHMRLFDKGDQIHVDIPLKTILPAGGFFLFERTNDDTVPGIAADLIYVGALGNANDGLRLFDAGCAMIDEVVASGDWPAGDVATKRSMERLPDLRWQTYSGAVDNSLYGTPKRATLVPPASGGPVAPIATSVAPSSLASALSGRVVISEVSAGTTNSSEDEFVELYNAGDAAVDMAGWALKKRTNSGSELSLVSSAAFVGVIAPRSFFLIAHEHFIGGPTPDLRYSANSVNLAYADNSAALYDASGALVDLVHWAEIPKAGSVERKSSGESVFAGNGYDTNTDSDFVVRAVREPQNSGSLPEPRSGPTLSSFNLDYDWATLTLSARWSPATDARGTTTGVFYQLDDVSDPAVPIAFGTTTATEFRHAITEVGRDYQFRLTPFDASELGGSATTVATSAPSFIDRLDFHNGFLDLAFSRYPFVPNLLHPSGSAWRLLVFYLNSAPPANPDSINASTHFAPEDLSRVLRVIYSNYSGENSGPGSVMLPDVPELSLPNGGPSNRAFYFPNIVHNTLLMRHASDRVLTPNDYLTIAYYDYYGYAAETFLRVATDVRKYYFQDPAPYNAPPTIPGNPMIGGLLNGYPSPHAEVLWDQSFDPDGHDDAVFYEANVFVGTSSPVTFDGGAWTRAPIRATAQDAPLGLRFHSPQPVVLGETYTFGIRAVDERGNASEVATTSAYTAPL